jgi:hypothetical protein
VVAFDPKATFKKEKKEKNLHCAMRIYSACIFAIDDIKG